MSRRQTATIRSCLAIAILGTAILPLLLGAGEHDQSQTGAGTIDRAEAQQRRERIAAMSAAQRQQLQRNWSAFQALPPERRRDYRVLHDQLRDDQQRGGKLSAVMDRYSAWLATLDPWQRDELRNETDPDQRLALVRKFKAEQEESQSHGREMLPTGMGSPFSGWFLSRIPALDEADLEAVMQVAAGSLPLSNQERAALRQLTPAQRHARILVHALRQQADRSSRRLAWPDDNTAAKMATVVKNEEARRWLESSRMSSDQRRYMLFGRILKSIFVEMNEVAQTLKPPRDQLEAFIRNVDPRERDELLKLPHQEARHRLLYLYLIEQQPEEFREYAELKKLLEEVFPRRLHHSPGHGDRSDGLRGPRHGGGPRGRTDGRPAGPDGDGSPRRPPSPTRERPFGTKTP